MYFPIINRLAIWGYMTRCNILESNLSTAPGEQIMNRVEIAFCFPSASAVLPGPLSRSLPIATPRSLRPS